MSAPDEKIIRAIVSPGYTLTAEEAQAEIDATTADDYDDWILSALHARIEGRIQFDEDCKGVEHPTARLFRIGIRSIQAGKPSSAFLVLLEQIAERAETLDVLHEVLPDVFPTAIKPKQMKAADDQAGIASEFKEFVKTHSPRGLSFGEIKAKFKIHMETQPQPISSKTVDRALETYGINWQAKPGRKPRKR